MPEASRPVSSRPASSERWRRRSASGQAAVRQRDRRRRSARPRAGMNGCAVACGHLPQRRDLARGRRRCRPPRRTPGTRQDIASVWISISPISSPSAWPRSSISRISSSDVVPRDQYERIEHVGQPRSVVQPPSELDRVCRGRSRPARCSPTHVERARESAEQPHPQLGVARPRARPRPPRAADRRVADRPGRQLASS